MLINVPKHGVSLEIMAPSMVFLPSALRRLCINALRGNQQVSQLKSGCARLPSYFGVFLHSHVNLAQSYFILKEIIEVDPCTSEVHFWMMHKPHSNTSFYGEILY